MNHFFRKIRYKLSLNDQFFKYVKYAIGESLLVVLEILIALQINNQNEQRIDQLMFDRVLIELEKELYANIFIRADI